MIYIFQGITGICSLPGLLCKACGDLCGKIHCDPCKEACFEASKCVRQFMGRPLSTYLVYSWIISGLEIYYSIAPSDRTCEFTKEQGAYVSLSGWRGIQMLFATLNIVFAPYMQIKVWRFIMETVRAAPPAVDPKTGKQVVPKKEVQNAFKKVWCEDFGVLFYFIAIILSVLWCVKGHEWGSNLTGDCSISFPAWLGQAQFALAFVYTFCWYCCPCCAKAIELEKQEEHYYDYGSGSDSSGE
jgi:hypothetical protein